eukprot:scaffold117320_cov18-Tisochrysis_lutea.AAC.1
MFIGLVLPVSRAGTLTTRFWQIISWSTYHSAVAVNREYNVYTNVLYLHVAIVGLLLAGLVVLALTVNNVQKSKKLQKWVKVLHVSTRTSMLDV